MNMTAAAALALAVAAASGASAAQAPSADQAAAASALSDATPAPATPAQAAAASSAAPEAAPAPPAPAAEAGPAGASPAPASMAQAPVVANPAHGLLSPPPAGKGQVVFFRNRSMYGGAVWYAVKENSHKLGDLSSGAFFVLPEDPGAHVFTAATENKDTLRMEVEAGETYYVRGTVQMGILVGEASIAPSDEDSFEKAFRHLHPAKTWPVEASAANVAKPPAVEPKP
jgi:hypothetical protein